MIRLQTQYVRCLSFFTERETQQKTVLRHKLFILVQVPTFIRSQAAREKYTQNWNKIRTQFSMVGLCLFHFDSLPITI